MLGFNLHWVTGYNYKIKINISVKFSFSTEQFKLKKNLNKMKNTQMPVSVHTQAIVDRIQNAKLTKANTITNKQITDLVRPFFIGTIIILSFVIFSSCARKAVFQVSSVVPAARGYVKVKKDYNKNYNIYVKLDNLAEPNRLTPPKKAYIVWIVANDNSTKNIGQVKTSTSLFSNALKGSFESVSSSKPVKVFITAEDDETVQFPSNLTVISTKDF